MIGRIMKAMFGSQNERELKAFASMVEKVNSLEAEIKELNDEQLKNKTGEFKHRLSEGQTLDNILPEAFAVVREASVRTLKMRHFDVQLIGGQALHDGKIAEMKTGEGKTLMATLAIYLNALAGKGVHVVTVNDYLAKRDAEWMSPIYEFLGMTVGSIQSNMKAGDRRKAYQSDITYGTNNEFGFDYLRDNMVEHSSLKVQRGHYFSIVDEVDSILVDEARTPLIISGAAEESTELYYQIDKIIPRLTPASKGEDFKWIDGSGDYQFEEKDRNVVLSEQGIAKVEKLLGVDNLYGAHNIDLVHHVNQALKAHVVFSRDVDYIVEDGQVVIIDEHTGRKMHGRRYSDGLHQALEAKERVTIEQETQTLASITFQNYFRMYDKLAGMTGTAETEAVEFNKIYKLRVLAIPTNQPLAREDHSDRIYRTEREKVNAVIDEIEECYRKGQPVLVGTISIEKNEKLSKALKRRGIPHNVLNAKFHDMEATVVAQGGQRGAVTIATNMAGRGTDIKLGEGVRELGGLHIIGTERHEARRIDNQLRGRAGRQGDPGSSRFYLCLEDDLMRLFGSERISGLMKRMGMDEGQEIEHPWITKAIANAQKKVEGRNFEIRKNLLEYDDVNNRQRQYIYKLRDEALYSDSLKDTVIGMLEDLVSSYANGIAEESGRNFSREQLDEVYAWVETHFDAPVPKSGDHMSLTREEDVTDFVQEHLKNAYVMREEKLGSGQMRELERYIMLYSIDSKWKDHLYNMDTMKEGIHLRAYAERNPLTEYKLEASNLFEGLKIAIMEETLEFLYKVEITQQTVFDQYNEDLQFGEEVHTEIGQFAGGGQDGRQRSGAKRGGGGIRSDKVKRNDPCPCGSGKKYKVCCGR